MVIEHAIAKKLLESKMWRKVFVALGMMGWSSGWFGIGKYLLFQHSKLIDFAKDQWCCLDLYRSRWCYWYHWMIYNKLSLRPLVRRSCSEAVIKFCQRKSWSNMVFSTANLAHFQISEARSISKGMVRLSWSGGWLGAWEECRRCWDGFAYWVA